MPSKKKKRDAAKRRVRRPQPSRQTGRERSVLASASFVKPDIQHEIRYITQRAQAEEARIVTLGKLVLFSTSTGDAWLLDSEDNLAHCLCRAGEPQPIRIVDTPESFGIEWSACFEIQGSAFVVQERSGRVVAIHGYPTAEIAAACRG